MVTRAPGGASAREARAFTTKPEEECDLVMEGGITSGVVYPPAILKLARRYRFRAVGGASAGAIAAAATAAAEYGREEGGFTAFEEMQQELASPGFLVGLAESALTAWLVGMALVLQVVGGVLIRRLGRVRA